MFTEPVPSLRNNSRNFDLLCDMAELMALYEKKSSLQDFLQDLVEMVARHMSADVCSVYLHNQANNLLVLRATIGLSLQPGQIVSLKPGQGITGVAFEESRSIREGNARSNPHFVALPGIEEDEYHAFLAVPILRGGTRIGVLTLQDRKKNAFSLQDTRALKAIASQLATSIENAEVLMEIHQEEAPLKPVSMKVSGNSAGSGIAIGSALVMRTRSSTFRPLPTPERRLDEEFSVTDELTRFAHALQKTKVQLETMQRTLDIKVAEVADLIFSAHLLILRDDKFSGAMQQDIQEGSTAEEAVTRVVNHYMEIFTRQENPRLREKAQDILDLGIRLVRNLANVDHMAGDYSGQIVIAPDVFPSEVVKLAAQNAAGFVAFGSGQTAHVALLARSLKLPALFVSTDEILSVSTGTRLILDGSHEELHINPSQSVIDRFTAITPGTSEKKAQESPKYCATKNGGAVRILANVNLIQDVETAIQYEAEGVGLYRSEFPFLVRNDFPSEEEQTRLYRRVVEPMEGREVVIRTLDVGGDKLLGIHQEFRESNPFLGFRGIRFSLSNREIFSDQIRAILRAGHDSNLHIMFPMISSLDEFLAAKHEVGLATAELAAEGLPHNPNPKLGAMVELPAAVEIADQLALHGDFLSIGTNDLIMYTLAVDRTNEKIGGMYTPHHPAVLRAIHRVVKAMGPKVSNLSVCGESVNDPAFMTFLLGLGITKLSVDPNRIPQLKLRVNNTDLAQATTISQEMLNIHSLSDMASYLRGRKLLD